MSESSSRLLSLLSAANSPLREEGVRLFVDHVLAHKVSDAIDLQAVHALVLRALTEANVGRIVSRHVKPGYLRYGDSVLSSEARVSDIVSSAARDKLRAVAAELRWPKAKWTRGAIEPALLRKLLGPVWMQVILNFAKRLPIPGVGAASPASAPAPAAVRGIAGILGRSVQQRAERLVDAGRSMMDSLGIDVEKKLQTAARDFSDSAMSIWNDALRERLASEEGRALLAQIHVGVVEHVLATKFVDLHRDAADLPVEAVLDLMPELIAPAAHSGYVLAIVERELAAYLQVEGGLSLAALLSELGLLDQVRAPIIAKGDELVRSLAAESAFADWLTRLLDASR